MRLQVERKRRPRGSKLSPGGAQAWPSATPKRPGKLEAEPKSFQVAKTRKSSFRAGESSTLRVARAPKNRPQRRQVALEVRLGGPSCAQEAPSCAWSAAWNAQVAPSCAWSAAWSAQVRPKRRQVALGVRLGRPKSVQVEPKRQP